MEMRGTLTAALLVLAPVVSGAGDRIDLPIGDGKWEIEGPGIRVERFDGRDVLSVETGSAVRREVSLQDGTIDFDVQLSRRRSFVYVTFRMADDREYEEIYLRPHKSGLPDAIQYAPVYQGQSGWQLHHGPGATAAAAFEPGVWTHVRLVLQDRRAALFLGDAPEPALLIPRLGHVPAAGYLGLRAFLPADTPGEGPIARYSNVTVRPGEVPFDFSSVRLEAEPVEPGAVRSWAVSRAFLPPDDGVAVALPGAKVLGEFRRVPAQADGLVELHAHVRLPSDTSRSAAAVARVNVRAETAGVRRLDLGFSDQATVFLNGRPLFHGDSHYSFDNPRQEGVIHYGQSTLFLPLSAGDNELAVLVADEFGGWGLMARFPDRSGLEVEAR
jgi:hypothetical protein